MKQNIFLNNPTAQAEPSEQKKQGGAVETESLNPSQYRAVTHDEGPVLVIAGAGSGKTRTLVHRMAWLLDQGVPPEAILLLTFTRRAAQEMLHRAARISGQSCTRVVGGTFHATANMLLRRYGHHLGFGAGFTIIDRGDAEGVVNLLRNSLGLAGAGKRFPSKRVILNLISGAINKSVNLEDLIFDTQGHLVEFSDDILRIRKDYEEFKLNNALMDYDDLLVNWQRLLSESTLARGEIASQFRYILVDEYQDTNLIQAQIVLLLAYGHDNVMVVGDDAQSIYSFRGADFYNIMRFPEQFPGADIIKLEQNYRSVQPVLALTNAIIAQAQEKYTKELFSEIKGGKKPILYPARNEAGEARFIVEKVKELVEAGTPSKEIAVLFRSGFHSYKLEMELAAHSLDFEKRGGMKLTEASHIKDVLSFLRVLINNWDNLSWNRILLQLDKVGPKTAQKILDTITAEDKPIQALGKYKTTAKWLGALRKLADAMAAMDRLDLTPSAIFDIVMEYYEPIFERIYHDDYPKRKRDLDQLKALIGGYGDLQSFVDDTALDPPESTPGAVEATPDKLILSTIHSAKGLEWDTVFVIGLAEGRFPHQKTIPGEQWEEERRLLYVAATRAKKQLYLTYPRTIMTPDRKFLNVVMSPFIREINPGLYVNKDAKPDYGQDFIAYRGNPDGVLPDPPSRKKETVSARTEFTKGMAVRHPFFGVGKIKDIPAPRRIEVRFDRHGDKLLHLDYAKLEIL
ncbi:MAG: ATP-dependent helicase [Candidatus Electrothrix aestuarii]|uniref:DNA 3'-5' helicase n=1 Tax=Candidatus Electrothrix aestuarii TaxID=3062594 RepID=A0AAU8LT33_9BACT|nr:ATP-dependent helicase [Candidatus Electrothrix aestuarii]